MKLIVGLGNPGTRYRGTRHNLGFEVVELLARRWGVGFTPQLPEALVARADGDRPVVLAKPLTYMNRSGEAVAALVRTFDVAVPDILLITDDVNLPVGHLRARARGSAGGHHGLRSVIEALATDRIARLRIGVGRGEGEQAHYVLARFPPEERQEIELAVERAADAAELFVAAGIDRVMNAYNRKVSERAR